jgi:hypothetical protein
MILVPQLVLTLREKKLGIDKIPVSGIPGSRHKDEGLGPMIKFPRTRPANGCAPSPLLPPPAAAMLPGSFHPLRLGTAWQLPYLYTVVQQNMLPSAHPFTGNGVAHAERKRSFRETAYRGDAVLRDVSKFRGRCVGGEHEPSGAGSTAVDPLRQCLLQSLPVDAAG